jgi:hypothetical protein
LHQETDISITPLLRQELLLFLVRMAMLSTLLLLVEVGAALLLLVEVVLVD